MRTIDPRHADQTDGATVEYGGGPSRRRVFALVFGGCLIVDVILLALVVAAWKDIVAFLSSDLFRGVVLIAGLVVLAWYYLRNATSAARKE
jgi:hypothetical protein